MSSNSITRRAPKHPNYVYYNGRKVFKSKTLLSKVMTLLVLISELKLGKKLPNNKAVISSSGTPNFGRTFTNYGRVFKKNGSRVSNSAQLPHEKIQAMAKTLIDSDKLGYFLFDLKKKIKAKSGMKMDYNIPDTEVEKLDKAMEVINTIIDPARPYNNTYFHVNGNPTGIEPVHSMFNDPAFRYENVVRSENLNKLMNEIEKTDVPYNSTRTFHTVNRNLTEGGLRNVKRSFRSSTRKAKRRSMHRSY